MSGGSDCAEGSEFTFTVRRRLFSASDYRPQRFHFGHGVMPDGDEFVTRGTALGRASPLVVIEDFRRLLNR